MEILLLRVRKHNFLKTRFYLAIKQRGPMGVYSVTFKNSCASVRLETAATVSTAPGAAGYSQQDRGASRPRTATPGAQLTRRGNVGGTRACPTLCHPMNCIVYVILQTRILEWVAVSFSRGSSEPRSPALQQVLYQLSHHHVRCQAG